MLFSGSPSAPVQGSLQSLSRILGLEGKLIAGGTAATASLGWLSPQKPLVLEGREENAISHYRNVICLGVRFFGSKGKAYPRYGTGAGHQGVNPISLMAPRPSFEG